MTISAEVIADSYNDFGVRLTTTKLTFHRYILPEFLTHRMFSRNSSSSRAIPSTKQIDWVVEDPVMFLDPGYNQPGMQAAEPLDADDLARVDAAWLEAMEAAVRAARVFAEVGLHKQHANRVLEPWMKQTVIVSTTNTDNFFDQRISALAQPEIDALAKAWKTALDESFSHYVPHGSYHLPYVTDEERQEYRDSLLIKFSIARCARVSYLTPEGNYDIEKDLKLYDRLVNASPPHWSPTEHVATPAPIDAYVGGNFRSWVQQRQVLEMPHVKTNG